MCASAIDQCPELGNLVVFQLRNMLTHPIAFRKNAGSVNEFRWDLRFEIIRQLTGIGLRGVQHKAGLAGMDLSTGAVTVACALLWRARSVRLVGFSFASKGTATIPRDSIRNHVSSDAALYALLSTYGFRIRQHRTIYRSLARFQD